MIEEIKVYKINHKYFYCLPELLLNIQYFLIDNLLFNIQ